jgi:PAS domain S-box-containing protein
VSEKLSQYHAFQIWLAQNTEIYKKNRVEALEIILSKMLKIIGSNRIGIWFFFSNSEILVEELTVSLSENPSHGLILTKEDFPEYFQLFHFKNIFQINSSENHFALKDPNQKYFSRFNIKSLINVPIFSDGAMIGVLSFEDTLEFREWDIHDQIFISACADFIGRMFETEKRHSYETELRHRINYLETHLKRRIDDLNEAKMSLDLALQSAKAGKWEWDIETNQCFYNNTWFENLGYKPNELPAELATFKRLIHPDDFDRVISTIDEYLKGERPIYECRLRLITKSGETKWFLDRGCIIKRNFDGSPGRLTGIIIDITHLVKLEETKRLSEQQLKSMIESLATPVAMMDRDLNILAYSKKWIEEWGGDTICEFSQNGWIEKINQALLGKDSSCDEDYVEFSNGHFKWLRWVIKPWRNSQNAISGVIIMVENITERKEAEMRMTQSSKLSALGEMAGGIAHEINNPLSIIKGYVELLKRYSNREVLSQETLKQYLSKIDQTVGRISKIVGGMRRFARESSMDEKTNYSLNKIVEETLDICLEKINNNGIQVDIEWLSSQDIVYCRPVEISQVLLNLINNSYHAVSSLEHPWIKIKLEESQESYRISIIDNGPGISSEIKKKLFQPFFTTKEIGVGTGLGLSISKGIVEEHRGRLYFDDSSSNTKFVVELPKPKSLSAPEIEQQLMI